MSGGKFAWMGAAIAAGAIACGFAFHWFSPAGRPAAVLDAAPREEEPRTARPAAGGDPVPFHIGLMTGTDYQGEDDFLGAREAIGLYGEAGRGGMIRHVTYPGHFISEIERVVAGIAELADDPLVKVIVVSQAVPGTAEGFREVKSKRPDIIRLAGEAHEDPRIIARAADLVVNSDFVSRGYRLALLAKKMGAGALVHISFPRHMIYEPLGRRRAIMEKACDSFGLKFHFENMPDPTGEAGIEGGRRFIREKFASWLNRHGPDTAFFCTSDSQAAPLIRQVADQGGFFLGSDMPSPLIGHFEAFGLEPPVDLGDWPAILRTVEEEAVRAGAGGRLGTGAHSLGLSQTAGLVEFGKLVAEGKARLDDARALFECFGKFSDGSRWDWEYYADAATGGRTDNYLLASQDAYVLGQGYSGISEAPVPPEYRGVHMGSVWEPSSPAFHIGLVTGDDDQSIDDLLGAREIIRLHRPVAGGGMVRHLVYPPNFMENAGETVKLIAGLADDPLMKVIVVNQAIPGTAEAFRQIKRKRPDIIRLAGQPSDDIEEITAAADLAVNLDFISQGYLVPHTAGRMGADTLVHISFPRHMSAKKRSRRWEIMKEACRDLGLKFAYEEAPDPTAEIGIEGARRFIMEKFPGWIERYGKKAAFFCTNDAHTEPLIRQIAAHGGYFIEPDVPSPLMGYPGAFGLDPQVESGNWLAVLREIEDAVVKAGAGGRLGTWGYSLGFCQTAGLAEFGKLVVEGGARLSDTKTLLRCFGKFSPGAKWSGVYLTDEVTGKPIDNYFLVYQDAYILGGGYAGRTGVEIPEKYLRIGIGPWDSKTP